VSKKSRYVGCTLTGN